MRLAWQWGTSLRIKKSLDQSGLCEESEISQSLIALLYQSYALLFDLLAYLFKHGQFLEMFHVIPLSLEMYLQEI